MGSLRSEVSTLKAGNGKEERDCSLAGFAIEQINGALKELDRSIVESFCNLQGENQRAVLAGPVLASSMQGAVSDSSCPDKKVPVPAFLLPKSPPSSLDNQKTTRHINYSEKKDNQKFQGQEKNDDRSQFKKLDPENQASTHKNVAPISKKQEQMRTKKSNQEEQIDGSDRAEVSGRPPRLLSPFTTSTRSARIDESKSCSRCEARAASPPAPTADGHANTSIEMSAEGMVAARRVHFEEPPPPGGKAGSSPPSSSRSYAARMIRAFARTFRPSS